MEEKKERLIEKLISEGYLKTEPVIKAFRLVARENFVRPEDIEHSYVDLPLPIGYKATISQPLTVAYMTECLDVYDNQNIMEIGAGSGYQAAILSVLNPNGIICTVENVLELAEMARKNLSDYKNVEVIHADGSCGLPDRAPFDRIMVTCYCTTVPEPWFEQLKEGGKMVAPVGSGFYQKLMLFEKIKGKIKKRDLNFPCAFVPLKGEHGAKRLGYF